MLRELEVVLPSVVSLLPSSKVTEESAEQPANTPYPMLSTLAGMVTEVSCELPRNTSLPSSVSREGSVTDFRLEPDNALDVE